MKSISVYLYPGSGKAPFEVFRELIREYGVKSSTNSELCILTPWISQHTVMEMVVYFDRVRLIVDSKYRGERGVKEALGFLRNLVENRKLRELHVRQLSGIHYTLALALIKGKPIFAILTSIPLTKWDRTPGEPGYLVTVEGDLDEIVDYYNRLFGKSKYVRLRK